MPAHPFGARPASERFATMVRMSQIPPLDADAVLWSAEPAQREGRPLLVLLHGYGSNEHDLFGLLPFLPEEFVVAAVRAPLTPPFPTPGSSWYPIEGLDHGRATESAAAVTAVTERLLQWIDTASSADHVGLLGFSQGAVVAAQALRLQPQRFTFAVLLSGYVDGGTVATDAALAEARPPVFWGRGSRDDVIPAARVAHTVQWLPDHVDLSGRVYEGLTHSVSQEELDDVRVFLDMRLAQIAEA